jgi:hypothetical protein
MRGTRLKKRIARFFAVPIEILKCYKRALITLKIPVIGTECHNIPYAREQFIQIAKLPNKVQDKRFLKTARMQRTMLTRRWKNVNRL